MLFLCNYTRVALFWISIQDDVRNRRHDLLDHMISQHGDSLMIILRTSCMKNKEDSSNRLYSAKFGGLIFYLHFLLGDAAGCSESNSQRGGDSAGTQASLLPAPVLQRLQANPGPATHVQRTHTCTNTSINSGVSQGSIVNPPLLFKKQWRK